MVVITTSTNSKVYIEHGHRQFKIDKLNASDWTVGGNGDFKS